MTPAEIKARRVGLGMTQVQLAQALDVSSTTISRWENGVEPVAHPSMLRLAMERLAESGAPVPATGRMER